MGVEYFLGYIYNCNLEILSSRAPKFDARMCTNIYEHALIDNREKWHTNKFTVEVYYKKLENLKSCILELFKNLYKIPLIREKFEFYFHFLGFHGL